MFISRAYSAILELQKQNFAVITSMISDN